MAENGSASRENGVWTSFRAIVTYSTRFHGRKWVRRLFSCVRSIPRIFDPGGRCFHFLAPVPYSTHFQGQKWVQTPFSRLQYILDVFDPTGRCVRFRDPVTTHFHGRTQFGRPLSCPHVYNPGAMCCHFRALVTYSTCFHGRKRVQRPSSHLQSIPHISTTGDGVAIFGLL
uniref:Uncharacterized protein n=1 Tax=Setaria viridis TaxID=4556 RepID=A0A4U6TE10_SETVI|nr:hypothetical protein SEVIR_8G000266v2 [Setaria viridis]